MAGAGKKLNNGGARHKHRSPAPSAADGNYGLPPHPARAGAGQRYVARQSRRHRSLTLAGSADRDGRCRARVECSQQLISVSAARLLATREDGQGRHFQFLGFRPRRYRTWAVIASLADHEAVIILPEWHSARPVRLPRRVLPATASGPGRWLRVSADLSASNAGRLNVAVVGICEKPPHLMIPASCGQAA